jgi:hypothetical protein
MRWLDHLAETTSRRHAVVLAPPSPELDRACHSRDCYSTLKGSRCAKTPKMTNVPEQQSSLKMRTIDPKG